MLAHVAVRYGDHVDCCFDLVLGFFDGSVYLTILVQPSPVLMERLLY